MKRFEEILLSGPAPQTSNASSAGKVGRCRRFRFRRRQLRSLCAALVLVSGVVPAGASAQTKQPAVKPPAVLLATSGAQTASAGALDSVIQAALEELGVVNIVAKPGMDLGAVQLALDCVAETDRCLFRVTTQQSAEVLIAPSIARTSGELVLSFLRFDARGQGTMKRVLRRQPGQVLTSATLDAVPDMLRELFELPPKSKQPEAAPTPAPSEEPGSLAPLPEPPMEAPSASRGVPVGPLLLAAGGALMLGSAGVLGLTVKSSQNDYDQKAQQVRTRADADRLDSISDAARTRATVANVLLGVGGVTLVAAGIWLAVDLANRPSESSYEAAARVSPWVGPHQLGLVWTQHGVGL